MRGCPSYAEGSKALRCSRQREVAAVIDRSFHLGIQQLIVLTWLTSSIS